MGKLTDQRHVSRHWVEKNMPWATGELKMFLIQAFGAGLDRGLAEAGEIMRDLAAEHGIQYSDEEN
jgi:hypothetical protein